MSFVRRGMILPTLCAIAGAAACSASDSASNDPDASPGCLIAFDAQYDGFRSWMSYRYDGVAEGDAGVHVAGPRTEYIESSPPHGSTTFPVGTIIVKEVGANDPANHHIFAMVKRGRGFNAAGATGWEWMEIEDLPPGGHILWRGVGPPVGEVYGGNPTGCNSCHEACNDNDSVCSTHIRLSNY